MGHVNKVSHVFTLSHVAEMLGEDEEWLFEVAEEMDPEDGQLWVVGVGEDWVMAFTDDGIETLKNLIQIHKDAPWIIEERRQVHLDERICNFSLNGASAVCGFRKRATHLQDYRRCEAMNARSNPPIDFSMRSSGIVSDKRM